MIGYDMCTFCVFSLVCGHFGRQKKLRLFPLFFIIFSWFMIMIPNALPLIYPEAQFQGETILDAAKKFHQTATFSPSNFYDFSPNWPAYLLWNMNIFWIFMKEEKYFLSLASKPTLWKQHLVPHLTSVVVKNQPNQIIISTELSKFRTWSYIEDIIPSARICNSFSAHPSVCHKNLNFSQMVKWIFPELLGVFLTT